MPQKKTITTLLFSIMFIVGLAFVGSATPASAQTQATDTTPFSLVPECARSRDTSTIPGLDCALLTFQNIASIIFGISGSVALLMFVYGGFLTLISGFSDQVKKGKEMIKNAVIGFFIIVIAAYGVDYFVSKLTDGKVQTVGSPCGGNGTWNYVGSTLKCVSVCTELGVGYNCVSDSAGLTCNNLIKCGNASQTCCAPPPPPPPSK